MFPTEDIRQRSLVDPSSRGIPCRSHSCRSDSVSIIDEAKKNNFRIIVAEDIGTVEPWNADLTGNVLFVVGAEREGVSQEVLDACDEVVRLPMDGFVPSYNLQVAISVLAVEALRQKYGH